MDLWRGASTVRKTLHRVEEVFISDWVRVVGARGGYSAVWDVVEVYSWRPKTIVIMELVSASRSRSWCRPTKI